MTQVIGARSDSTLFRLQPGQFEQNTESASCGFNWQPALVHADEKTGVPFRRCVRHALSMVSIQFSR